MTAKWERKLEEIHIKGLYYKGYKNFLDEIKDFVFLEVGRFVG